MFDQMNSMPMQSPTPLATPVKLWTPSFIAGVSFLFGFPAGIVIASINWVRMKMNEKAYIHLGAGAVGAFILVIVLMLTPGTLGRAVGLVVNIGVLLYLQKQMKQDIESFKLTNNAFENAGQLGGCLIGLGVLVIFVAMIFVVAFVLVILGIPIPD